MDHTLYREWIEGIIQSGQFYGISDHVLSGFLRVVTHPRVFTSPSPMRSALDFARQVRERPSCRIIVPGGRKWDAHFRQFSRARYWAEVRRAFLLHDAPKLILMRSR